MGDEHTMYDWETKADRLQLDVEVVLVDLIQTKTVAVGRKNITQSESVCPAEMYIRNYRRECDNRDNMIIIKAIERWICYELNIDIRSNSIDKIFSLPSEEDRGLRGQGVSERAIEKKTNKRVIFHTIKLKLLMSFWANQMDA